MTAADIPSSDLSESDLWALALGQQMFRWAATCQLMRHASPAGTTMYVHADTSTVAGVAVQASKDFIDWCAGRDPEAGDRFIAFADSLGFTTREAANALAEHLMPIERAS